jgi:16S rRNA G966 N2-methylase RsmD
MHSRLSAESKEVLIKIDAVISMVGYMYSGGLGSVTDFNVCLRMIDTTDSTNFTKQLIDPACGKGSMLLAKIKRLIENGCDVETAVSLVHGVDIDQSQVDHARINIYRATGYLPDIVCDNSLKKEFNMKFDVVITNPPYKGQSMLHQQFFNLGVELVKEGGQVVCLQPAIAYFNKKEKTDDQSQLMRDNIKKYKTKVDFVSPKIFGTAAPANDLSITTLTKVKDNAEIREVVYTSGKTFNNVTLENVTKLEMDPIAYESVAAKYKSYIKKHGSIEKITSKKDGEEKVKIAAIRGNVAIGSDWYTFIPNKEDDLRLTSKDFGILTNNSKENAGAIHHNLKLTSIRFGLAIYKFSTDMHGGAMRGVPLIDFYKKYTDQDVYNLLGITLEEQAEIERVIPSYYD